MRQGEGYCYSAIRKGQGEGNYYKKGTGRGILLYERDRERYITIRMILGEGYYYKKGEVYFYKKGTR